MRYEVADGVATLTLDKPDARNVLDADTMAALSDGLVRGHGFVDQSRLRDACG